MLLQGQSESERFDRVTRVLAWAAHKRAATLCWEVAAELQGGSYSPRRSAAAWEPPMDSRA